MQAKSTFFWTVFIIQICLGKLVMAQALTGTVYNNVSGEPIPFATIYIEASFLGVSANADGVFSWTSMNFLEMPLTVSAIGYYSKVIYPENQTCKVYLEPKTYSIDETLVESESLIKKRKRYLRIFKNEFLGITDNARHCIIFNEDDIYFDYSVEDTVRAFVDKPLLIHNQALGYRISYFIDVFEYAKKNTNTLFKGSIQFTEDADTLGSEKQYDDIRAYAYESSRMHFFRSLWTLDLKRQGFKLLNAEFEAINYKKCIVEDEQQNKYFVHDGNLIIERFDKVSIAMIMKNKIYFDSSGFYDPSAIIWKGAMSEQRVADWLPYEYMLITK